MRLVSFVAIVIVIVVSAGCGDDLSLRVDVVHEVTPASTTISVYESASRTCLEIEFGDVTEDELAGLLVAELTIDGTGRTSGSLDGLARTDPKLIVARGYDDAGQLMTAGCTEHGTIGERDQVTVTTTRASIASIGQVVSPDDLVNAFAVAVTLSDVDGAPLTQNRLSWRVYAPAGSKPDPSPSMVSPSPRGWQLAEPTCTNVEGGRLVHPPPPSTVGGYAIQIRPSWPIVTPPLITGFTRIDGRGQVLDPSTTTIKHPCAIRIQNGAPTIACVERDANDPTKLVVNSYTATASGGDVTITRSGLPIAVPANVVALYAIRRANGDQDVLALTQSGGVVQPGGGAPVGSLPGAGELAEDALLIPSCVENQAPRLLIGTNLPGVGRRMVVMSADGGPGMPFHDASSPMVMSLTLRSAGCVKVVGPDGGAARQAIVVDSVTVGAMVRRSTVAHFECHLGNDPRCSVALPVLGAGVGFTAGGPSPRLAGTSLDASGVVVAQWTMLYEGPVIGFRRVELARVAAASVPRHIVYGQFDDDTESDAFWDIVNADQSESGFQVTYAQLAATAPLSAVTAGQRLVVSDLLVGTVTQGDPHDDLVLIGTSEGVTKFIVIPPQSAAKPSGIGGRDVPCP